MLEVGTGTGFLALVAARRARQTVGTDINPEAVRALKINALLNHLEDRVEARQGDLFAPVAGEQFDVILFNPPYLRGRSAGFVGLRVARRRPDARALRRTRLAQFLDPGGRLLICDSDVAIDRMDRALTSAGYAVTVVRSGTIVSGEVLTVYSAARPA